MQSPRFLVIEGPDGAGKTTQLSLLRQHLEDQGHTVLQVREPGGTVIGEGIRSLFLDNFGHTHPMTEVLMMLAARQQLVAEVIQPALAAGTWVIADRYSPSTIAYQGYGHGVGHQAIVELRRGLRHWDLKAHHTVILTLSMAERERRLANRDDLNALDKAKTSFIEQVRQAYQDMATGRIDIEAGPMSRVDAMGTPEEVHRRILQAMQLIPTE